MVWSAHINFTILDIHFHLYYGTAVFFFFGEISLKENILCATVNKLHN